MIDPKRILDSMKHREDAGEMAPGHADEIRSEGWIYGMEL